MGAEGNNPTRQVQRVHDASLGSRYSPDIFAALHFSKPQWSPLLQQQQQLLLHAERPLPEVFCSRRWLGNKDLCWQQQQINHLLLEERMQLLKDSQLMNNSLLAAYTYEQCAQRHLTPLAILTTSGAEQAPNARENHPGPAAAEETGRTKEAPLASEALAATTPAAVPAAANEQLPDVLHSTADCSKATTCCIDIKECSSNSGSRNSCSRGSSTSNNAVHLIYQRRARLFARNEILTAQEVYAAVRCITDPEYPYTLEELMVVLPEYVKVPCSCYSNDSSSDSGSANAKGRSSYSCMQHQQLQQQLQMQHWRRMRGLRVDINFRPTIPHCSEVKGFALFLAAAVAASTAACTP
ncbi:hypothetical protein, conserved [Eimeria acervulina]|uniref:Uncharacterized protein n=1 Tax=Eimeria acervulina TaxID=5801 RepID=U6GNF3_EIMAC|nr:hypothetical protein, conserved [Eimeria acervulina]CDI81092.1 hypothetical protein, conserved [Eimeria acervulina]